MCNRTLHSLIKLNKTFRFEGCRSKLNYSCLIVTNFLLSPIIFSIMRKNLKKRKKHFFWLIVFGLFILLFIFLSFSSSLIFSMYFILFCNFFQHRLFLIPPTTFLPSFSSFFLTLLKHIRFYKSPCPKGIWKFFFLSNPNIL